MELGVSFTGFFVALGIEPHASHTLDKRPSTELHSLSFGYFLFGVRVSLRCPCRALNLRSSFLNALSHWDFVCVPPSPDHHSGFNPALLADLGRQSEESPLPDVIASQVYQDRTGKPGQCCHRKGDLGQRPPPPQFCRVLSMSWHVTSDATRLSASRGQGLFTMLALHQQLVRCRLF